MAKYTRYRKYSRRSKGRWSPNIQEINTTSIQAPANSSFHYSYTLAFNPIQTNTAVSQKYTVKRIEVSYYIDVDQVQYSNIQHLEDIAAYIMFVPQGMTVSGDYNIQHPEYIMSYQLLGSPYSDFSVSSSPAGQQFQPRKISTRLSRKLNTGDSVILFIKGNNTGTEQSAYFDFHGLVRWWTKARVYE